MKLITFTPYAREGQTYFEAIQECMALLDVDDVAVIQDHDILHTTPHWHRIITNHVAQGMVFGTCLTNRIGCAWQKDLDAPEGNDDAEHFAHGHHRAKEMKGKKRNCTTKQLASGHLFVISRKAWERAMEDVSDAPETVLGVDNYIHRKMREAGVELHLMLDLYVYHRYRFGNNAASGHLRTPPMRKVCFTVITGDYDQLQEPEYITPGWEYHLYHDGRITVPADSIWQPHVLNNPDHLTPVLLQRANKAVCPVRKRTEGELLRTVYVDGNQVIIGNLDVFVTETGHEAGGITSKTHPERDCLWQEAEAIVKQGKCPAHDVVRMLAVLNDWKEGPHGGLSETGIHIRDYFGGNAEKRMRGQELQWQECLLRHCHRDQLSFDPIFQDDLNRAPMEPFTKCFKKVKHGTDALPVVSRALPVPRPKEYPLTVFTVADANYAKFTPLFVASVLWSNPEARVQVAIPTNCAVPDMLPCVKRWPDRFIITRDERLNSEATALYGTMRWLIEPMLKAKYLYIGDIDIIVMQDLLTLHLPKLKEWGMPYSNAVREGTTRMTGLHFTEWDALHPHRFLAENRPPIHQNDEEVLYRIVTGNGHGLPPEFYRPVPGIHISPNRHPHKSQAPDGREIPGWGIEGREGDFRMFRETEWYGELLEVLHPDVVKCLGQINEVVDRKEVERCR